MHKTLQNNLVTAIEQAEGRAVDDVQQMTWASDLH